MWGSDKIRFFLLALTAAVCLCGGARAVAQETAPYCADLKRVMASASEMIGKNKVPFGSIVDKTGVNFSLPGWSNCKIEDPSNDVARRDYSCESQKFPSQQEAVNLLLASVREIVACLGTPWKQKMLKENDMFVIEDFPSDPVSMMLVRPHFHNDYWVVLTVRRDPLR